MTRSRRAAFAALLVLTPALAGCASMRAYQERIAAKKRAEQLARTGPATPAESGVPGVRPTRLTALPPPDGSVAPVPAPSLTAEPAVGAAGNAAPAGMQFLYGSGEAAALSLQAYLALNDRIMTEATARQIGHDQQSVVLAPGATLAAPKFLPCGNKPLAVVLDIDETSLLNLGYEAGEAGRGATAFDARRWEAWERTGANAVVAVPGALEAQAVARAVGVVFVFNSNRSAANASATAAALERAGLGAMQHGSTLWLQGDAGGGSGKDARRAAIAAKYCVIAMVGDQLGDFSDQFNAPGLTPVARRALASGKALKTVWGHGWFMLPNPVYGPALKGGIDDVFPADRRWTPAADASDRGAN